MLILLIEVIFGILKMIDGSRWLVIVDEGSKKGIRNAIRRVKRGAIRFEKVKNRIMNGIFRSAKTL